MAQEEKKTAEIEPVQLGESDTSFIREQHEDEGPIKFFLGQSCTVIKQEKKKVNYLDRTVILTDLRFFILKTGFMRKIDSTFLLVNLTEVTYREFDFGNIGLSLKFTYPNPNANKKNQSATLTEEIIIASKDKSQVLHWISRLLLCINALKQCIVFDPLLDIPPESSGIHLEPIYDKRKLVLAYQTLCAQHNVGIRLALIQLFKDDAFYWNEFIDLFQILKATVDKKKNNKKGFVAIPIEIAILLKSLHYVADSFTAVHLDALELTEDIVIGIANLISINPKLKTLALRSTQLTPKLMQLLNNRLKAKNGDSRTTTLDALVLSSNDFSDPSSFIAIDPSVIQVKKLYLQDCQLTKESFDVLINHLLLSKEWNNKTTKYNLQKLDISDNFKKQDALLMQIFSKWLKQVDCNLREFRMGGCGLSLNFIQDLASNKTLFANTLRLLDLSNNELTPYCAGALKQILSETSSIELLILSEMRLDPLLLTEFLTGIFKNSQCSMTMDLTRCNLHKTKFGATLANVINDAKKDNIDTKNAGLRGLILTHNELHDDLIEFQSIAKNLCNYHSIERLILDYNFLYNKKKGYYSTIINELVNSLRQMDSIQMLSIRGNYDNSGKINNKTSYLLEYDDLIPLFQYVGGSAALELNDDSSSNKNKKSKKQNKKDGKEDSHSGNVSAMENGAECNLKYLYLDGNHLGEKGCKMLGESLKFNSKLEILSCEDCKISLKGLKALLAGVTGVDQSIYDILPLQTLKFLKEDTSNKNWTKFTENELNNTLDVCRKNLEKMELLRQEQRQRRKTEARERRKTVDAPSRNRGGSRPPPRKAAGAPARNKPKPPPPSGSGAKPPPPKSKSAAVTSTVVASPKSPSSKASENKAASGDNKDEDTLALGDDVSNNTNNDEDSAYSSDDDIMDGYNSPGGPDSGMTKGKSQQTKVLRLARLLQTGDNGGKLPIHMGPRPSGLVKPHMGNAGSFTTALKGGDDSDGDEKESGSLAGTAKNKEEKDINGMKVLTTDSTEAKLSVPSAAPTGRKKRTRKKLDV